MLFLQTVRERISGGKRDRKDGGSRRNGRDGRSRWEGGWMAGEMDKMRDGNGRVKIRPKRRIWRGRLEERWKWEIMRQRLMMEIGKTGNESGKNR